MSKKLKAPRYKKVVAYLEGVMMDPRESGKSRMAAAFRLDDLYARLEISDEKTAAHKRKKELRALQVANPTLPLPDTAADNEDTAKIKSVFDEVLKPGGASAEG